MMRTQLEDFPHEILVDAAKSHEAVFVHPDQSIFAHDSIADSFRKIDETYRADPEARIRFMADSVQHFRLPGSAGFPAKVNIAYESDDSDAESDEIMIVTSPLNDGKPKSDADAMVEFINTPDPSFGQIATTRPNSWSPLVKLDIAYQVSEASGRPMPHLQLFSRLSPHALSIGERAKLAIGDYSGFGRVAIEAIQYVNEIRNVEGKTPVRVAHFFGAGIGQRALGAARYALENQAEFEVGSAHAMNLALHRGLVGGAVDHFQQRKVNEPSDIIIPPRHVRIEEPQVRQDTDQHGSDTLQLWGRQFWAMKDLLATTLPLMLCYEPTVDDVETLMAGDVPVRVTNGLNTGMTINTLRMLPIGDPRLRYSTIVGLEGQQVGMMANEHAGVVATVMPLGVRDYDNLKSAA
jgi:hypothetical protein